MIMSNSTILRLTTASLLRPTVWAGAISLDNSTLKLDGETAFTGNNAQSSGGKRVVTLTLTLTVTTMQTKQTAFLRTYQTF